MLGRKSFAIVLLLALASSAVQSQTGAPGSSRIDRLNRQRDALKRRTEALATLRISYSSSGDLITSLEKNSPQSLFVLAKVDGDRVKGLAKGQKPKVAKEIKQGVFELEATWTRPGTRLRTECQAALQVGFQEALILPYGGTENFSCQVLPRLLPDEILEEWKKGLETEQAGVVADCSKTEEMASTGFWACIDRGGLPLPQG